MCSYNIVFITITFISNVVFFSSALYAKPYENCPNNPQSKKQSQISKVLLSNLPTTFDCFWFSSCTAIFFLHQQLWFLKIVISREMLWRLVWIGVYKWRKRTKFSCTLMLWRRLFSHFPLSPICISGTHPGCLNIVKLIYFWTTISFLIMMICYK